jgi:hypothetical protein
MPFTLLPYPYIYKGKDSSEEPRGGVTPKSLPSPPLRLVPRKTYCLVLPRKEKLAAAPTRALGRGGWVWYTNGMKPGLYANINARRKAGTSRPKSKSTISPKIWRMMKAKKGGFSEKPKG